jgi:5-methylcytosine-specific restriction endonuclease McrA
MKSEPEHLTRKYPRRSRQGECLLCGRHTFLTFHHLIPKKMHRRTFFKKQFSKAELAAGIDICRQCHDGIHRSYTEMELAKQYPSLEALKADEKLKAHFDWVSKQKVGRF